MGRGLDEEAMMATARRCTREREVAGSAGRWREGGVVVGRWGVESLWFAQSRRDEQAGGGGGKGGEGLIIASISKEGSSQEKAGMMLRRRGFTTETRAVMCSNAEVRLVGVTGSNEQSHLTTRSIS